jgi:hypothetical protein
MTNLQLSEKCSKSDIIRISQDAINEIIETGKIVQGAELIIKMEALIKEIRGNIQFVEAVREEVAKFGKSLETASGTKIELAEVGTKYEFGQCGDPVLRQLEADVNELSAKLKERQAFLKALPSSGIDFVDQEGEVHKIYPPSKYSTSSFKATISK